MTDEVRDVVGKARAERAPSAEDRERIRRRLAVAIAAGAAGAGASAAAGASASATSASGIAAWIKIGLATIALGGVGVVAHRVVTQEETPTVARAPSEPPTLAIEPVVIATETNDTEPAREEPTPTRRRRAATTDDLARELEALHEAQRAWRSGDARAVLRHVRAHEDTFPRSQFRAERRALEILALCALGERAEAQRLTRRFLDTAPDSPARRSVLESCGAPEVR